MTTKLKEMDSASNSADLATADLATMVIEESIISKSPRSSESVAILPSSAEFGSLSNKSTKSASRLTIAEKAFARGLKALRDKNYQESRRQLSGFLELTAGHLRSKEGQTASPKSHTLQGIQVVVEALELLLAISEEITIMEADGR